MTVAARDNRDNHPFSYSHDPVTSAETVVTTGTRDTVMGQPPAGHPQGTPAEYGLGPVAALLGGPEREGYNPPPISPPPEWVQLAEDVGEPFPPRLFAAALRSYGHRIEAAASRINASWHLAVASRDREALELVLLEEDLLLGWLEQQATRPQPHAD